MIDKVVYFLSEEFRKEGLLVPFGTTYRIAENLIANGVRLDGKQATSKTSEQFASDNNVGHWIPVTERLPSGTERVLVFLKPEPFADCIMDTDRLKDGRWVRWGKNVTHWMPLPEPPKEDE